METSDPRGGWVYLPGRRALGASFRDPRLLLSEHLLLLRFHRRALRRVLGPRFLQPRLLLSAHLLKVRIRSRALRLALGRPLLLLRLGLGAELRSLRFLRVRQPRSVARVRRLDCATATHGASGVRSLQEGLHASLRKSSLRAWQRTGARICVNGTA